jgi:predicted phage terminase large subunit-like protein
MMNLSPSDRKQLLDGVWEIDTLGRKFRRSWFKIVQDIPKGIRQVRCWDLAATPKIEDDPSSDPDYCTGIRGGISKAGIYYVTDVRRIRATPHRVEEFILRTAQLDGKQVRIYIEREPGASGKITESHFMRNVLNGFNMSGIPRVSKLRKEERADPVSSKAEQGLVCVLEAPWNHDFFDELEQFPDGDHDDMVDAFVDVVTKSEATPFKIWS